MKVMTIRVSTLKNEGKYVIICILTFYKSHLILLLAVCQILYQMAYYYFFSLVRQYSGRFSDHGSSFFNSSSLGKAPIFLSSSNI